MAVNRKVFGKFLTETNNLALASSNQVFSGRGKALENTYFTTTMQTAGQTVNEDIDVETGNPLLIAQAISHYAHTSQSYIEATGSVVNAYILEQVNSYSITDQNNTSATIRQPSITSYVNGMVINVFITNGNTGTSTIALRYTTASATNPIVYSQATLSTIPIYKQYFNSNTFSLLNGGELFGNTQLMYLSNVPGFGAGFVVLSPTYNMIAPAFITNNILPYSTISANTVNGRASFITNPSNTQINFTFTTPIKVCFPNGVQETYTSATDLPNITGIATNGTAIIIKELNVIQPIAYFGTVTESITAPVAPVNGDYWLDISVLPYIPYKRIGGVWVATQFVKLGEFTRTAGVIGTITSYALNRVDRTIAVNLTGAGTYIQPHILGYRGNLVSADIYAVCTTATSGFQIGDAVILKHSENTGATQGFNATPSYSRVSVSATLNNFAWITSPTGTLINIMVTGVNNFNIGFILRTNF